MLSIRNASLLAGAAIVIATAFYWHQRTAWTSPPATVTQAALPTVAPHHKSEPPKPVPTQARSASVATSTSSLLKRLNSAKDWFALAKEYLSLAKSGDPGAQLLIFFAYEGCQSAMGANTESVQSARDEALRVFRNSPNSFKMADKAESEFIRCHGFYTDEASALGDHYEWLQKATDAGYPPAEAMTAQYRFRQDNAKALAREGGNPDNPLINLPPFGGDADPRDLLLDALQTGDVDAMGTIANLQLYLNPQASRDETDINRIAWNYVGCQHGADCSGYGPATITNCGPNQVNCTPVPDQLMKMANYNWAPVQEKVDQINAALNAKQWDKLPGFTLTGG